MEGSIIFYTYGSTLELNGQQFTAGMLTADLLNLSPDEYRPMSKRMKQVTGLAEEYEQSGSIELWWKLNGELAALCGVLRRYAVFRLLLDESEDAFFSVIREITGQFDLFPKEEHEPSEEIQRKRLERVANEISARSETVKDVPLDLFHPSEAALEKGDAFYYEMLRAIGPTKDAWRDYKKYIRRYETYLHDIRAFNGTIRNFISFSLSKLKHNSPEDYAAALYGFYNDERIAEKLIVNPIRNNGDCYTTHDAYELSYVPRPLPDGTVAICQEHVTDSLQALMKADYMLALNSGHNIHRCIHLRTVFSAQERCPCFVLRRGVSPCARLHLPAVRHGGVAEGVSEGHSQGQSQGDRFCPLHKGYAAGCYLTGGCKKSQGLCAGSAL